MTSAFWSLTYVLAWIGWIIQLGGNVSVREDRSRKQPIASTTSLLPTGRGSGELFRESGLQAHPVARLHLVVSWPAG